MSRLCACGATIARGIRALSCSPSCSWKARDQRRGSKRRSVAISTDVYADLVIYAERTGRSMSAIVEDVISAACPGAQAELGGGR